MITIHKSNDVGELLTRIATTELQKMVASKFLAFGYSTELVCEIRIELRDVDSLDTRREISLKLPTIKCSKEHRLAASEEDEEYSCDVSY